LPDINEEKMNLTRVAQNYERAIAKYNGAISRIDGTQRPDKVHTEIIAVLQSKGML
jgi:thymidylate kinase